MSMRLFPLFDPIGAQAPDPRKTRAAALAAFTFACMLVLAGCGREPPEQALRDTIATMEEAAEAGDADALFEPIAEDFAGSQAMDRDAFRRYVLVMGLRRQTVGVQLGPLDVKLFGDRASVAFTAALTGGPGWLPDRAQVYDVTTGWRMDDGEWKLISASWREKL
jgi:ketosteroid isomerase-like protein